MSKSERIQAWKWMGEFDPHYVILVIQFETHQILQMGDGSFRLQPHRDGYPWYDIASDDRDDWMPVGI